MTSDTTAQGKEDRMETVGVKGSTLYLDVRDQSGLLAVDVKNIIAISYRRSPHFENIIAISYRRSPHFENLKDECVVVASVDSDHKRFLVNHSALTVALMIERARGWSTMSLWGEHPPEHRSQAARYARNRHDAALDEHSREKIVPAGSTDDTDAPDYLQEGYVELTVSGPHSDYGVPTPHIVRADFIDFVCESAQGGCFIGTKRGDVWQSPDSHREVMIAVAKGRKALADMERPSYTLQMGATS